MNLLAHPINRMCISNFQENSDSYQINYLKPPPQNESILFVVKENNVLQKVI